MAERTKQTRLEELDLRAKSLLEAWNKDTFGKRQQAAAGVNDSTLPFKRFAADHHKRRTESQIQASAIEAYKDGGFDAFFKEVDESNRTDPPTLEERWEKSAFKGGPANEAKGGGSSTTNVSAKLSSPRPYEGEQNGQLSIKLNDQDFFVPDSPFNRDIWEKFQNTYTSGKPDEDGKGHFDYFFQLADAVGTPAFGNATIRAHWEKLFAWRGPMTPATKIFRRNMWAQQDLKAQYDEGRDYRWTDSYYRYDVATPDLEFGNADDPLTKQNHQSFTLKRKDANTIELATNIQRATVQNPSGTQWPNKTEHGSSTFTRSDSYDHRMKVSSVFAKNNGELAPTKNAGDTKIEPQPNAWPWISSIPPNDKPYAIDRRARNLEELWLSSKHISTDGPFSSAVSRNDAGVHLSTFFSGNAINDRDYRIRFLSSLNGSFTSVPTESDVRNQGSLRFNAGQVAPYSNNRYVFGGSREMDRYDNDQLKRIFETIYAYEQDLMEIKPGGNRIKIAFNIRVNLNKLLHQNLLMPPDIHPTDVVLEERDRRNLDLAVIRQDVNAPTHIDDDTFTKLYLKNRSVLHSAAHAGDQRNPPGTIGAVAVADLQSPVTYQDGGDGKYETTGADDDHTVFKFIEEDGPQGRNNTITQDRGFIDNIAGQVQGQRHGIAGLMPAVENDEGSAFADRTSFGKTRGRADAQFFPFMFETVNKRGSARNGTEYKQYAYFQATLQSLNESYAPAWSSKHFFGRTEQIHTYTMTERTIDFSFVIFATEIRRLQNLYERVTWLAQQTYPSYDSNLRLKSGPLIKMTIGDMFSGLNGFIRSLSFDWNHLGPGGKWEITQGLRIPMSCTVTINFTVMHDAMPDRNYALYPGPLGGGKGLIGERGKTNDFPEGGPLIATVGGKPNEDVVFMEQQLEMARARGTSKADLEHLSKRVEIRKAESDRKQQYIDWTQKNRYTGTVLPIPGMAGEHDLVFD